MIAKSIPRLKDVLFALSAAAEYSQRLGRLPLQKLIYLADVLVPIWRDMAKPAGFSPYRNGPYDKRIQNTVDALVFRGVVEVSATRFRQIKGIECSYSLNETGHKLVKEITNNHDFKDELELFREISREISKRGWKNIKKLVYAEPTYDLARTSGESGRLRTDSLAFNLSYDFLQDFKESLRSLDGSPVSRRNLVQMFFSVLDQQPNISKDFELEDVE